MFVFSEVAHKLYAQPLFSYITIMPNHIINTIRLTGDREKISELLESVKDNRFGIGSLDFNKVIPMPESLQIETSSSISEQDCRFFRFFASAYLATKTIPNRLATTANTRYIKSCDI